LPIDAERQLEQILADPNLLLIGRQVPITFSKSIDLLALDTDGKVVALELKRDRTPREVVAELLDYGSREWIHTIERLKSRLGVLN
jgi:RecB family endonuclease NucS